MKKIKTILLATLFSASILTAEAAGIGTWTLYPTYADITEIEPTGKQTYVLASGSLFSYNPADGQLQVYDKVSPLSDNNIRHIAWSRQAKRLIIVYDDSNIDLLSADGTVTNVPDIYQKSMTFDKGINHICVSGTSAYLSTDFGVVKLNVAGGSIADTYQLGYKVDYSYVKGNNIYAVSQVWGTYRGDMSLNLLDKANWVWDSGYTPLSVDRKNVKDEQTGYWWTVTDAGKLTYYTLSDTGEKTYQTEGVLPDGPSSNNFYRVYVNNSKVYGVGGAWNDLIDAGRPGEVHVFDGTSWSEFATPAADPARRCWGDVLCLDFDPRDADHVFVGSKNGLFEYKYNTFVKYYSKDDNPGFTSVGDGYAYTLITGVRYNQSGNLFVLNSQTNNSLQMFNEAENKWTILAKGHNFDGNNFDVSGMIFDRNYKYLWFQNSKYNANMLYAYDFANDKLYTYGPSLVNQDGITLSASYIYGPVEDREGNIWIGSDVGPVYLAASTIEAGESYFTQYKVPRNDGTNNADYLLSNVSVLSMAVDGGNRKWFGSNGAGAFLVSADNNTQLQHFTTTNSPLPSDIINDIAIDGKTGTVYFATDRGLAAYQSNASEPADNMTKDNVYAYPNPVRPDYTGMITITGLTYDADVKIVTSNGVLVNQGRSTGGMYQWDGTDLKGRHVASGVYMVETATSSGGSGTVCKIAVVN